MRFLILAITIATSFGASFYVDSDWGGTQSGTEAEPFKSLTVGAWSSINTALASESVTVYFSARNATSDTAQIYSSTGSTSADTDVDLTKRTDGSANVLTLDGWSYFNSDDSVPSWESYTGTNKCVVRRFFSQNLAHNKYSNITIHGFHVLSSIDKCITIAGDNWIVRYNRLEQTNGVSGGPCLLIVPTADAAHEGSSAYSPILTNILVISNVIHNTFGEAIYVGGGGTVPGEAGSGYPSHDDVRIIGNTIYDTAAYGGQGDGIDVKGGISNLLISGNTIWNLRADGSTARGIVTQGFYDVASDARSINGNIIHSITNICDGAIAIANSWGTQLGTLIYNNLIYNNSGVGSTTGIRVYSGAVTNINNTIYASSSYAIASDSGSTVHNQNNFFIKNRSSGTQLSLLGTVSFSNYNAWEGSALGYASEGEQSFSTADSANFVSAGSDFRLSVDAPAVGAALASGYFTSDLAGNARGAVWDIGAYEHAPAPAIVFSGSAQVSGNVILK